MTITLDRDTRRRRCVAGADPDLRYPVPEMETEFAPAPDIEGLAEALIEADRGRLWLAGRFKVLYRWKAEGGQGGGKPTLGRCAKLTGALRYETGADFLVWLAADHCAAADLTNWQVEALIGRQLLRIGLSKKGAPALVPFDWEGFAWEIEHYGLWWRDLERVGTAVAALQLPLVAANGAGS